MKSQSKFEESGTLTIKENGQVFLGIDSEGNNAFKNTALSGDKVTIKGDNNSDTTDLVLETGNLVGNTAKVEFGESVTVGADGNTVTVKADSDIYEIKDSELNGNVSEVELAYNTNLYKDNSILNNINNAASNVSNLFSKNTDEREIQLDKIYAGNIYSETVKAAYEGIKMSENTILSMAHDVKAGELKTDGKALYSKNEYSKDGTIGSYDTEVETTGLLASFEYGINDSTTAGFVFSGAKQDVDTDGGNADADLFYLGVFGTKVVGNYDFTAGLGYQFGKYEADNSIANITSSDKYDSSAFNGYIQGKYTADLGDGLSVQPKIKLGYTYIDQDDTKDSYFGVSDAEISTFDTEVGFDVVKSIQFEKSNLDVKFGASYIKTMGDTDDEFTGRFYGETASEGFNVLGAELAENMVKFNVNAEVTRENGFFYNGGFTYEFGSNDTEAYSINAGVGYKF